MRRLTLRLGEAQAGRTVHTLLRQELLLSAASVRRAKTLPDGILLDGQPVFTNQTGRAGQLLSVAVGDVAGSEQIPPVPGPLTIRYEDEDLVVVEKEGGVPVHPSQGHHGDTLANFLLAHYRDQGLVAAFHPVNRLDRGTSGLMAVATPTPTSGSSTSCGRGSWRAPTWRYAKGCRCPAGAVWTSPSAGCRGRC